MASQYKVVCDCCGKDVTNRFVRFGSDNNFGLSANSTLYANCQQYIRPYYFSMDLCTDCYEEIVNQITAYVNDRKKDAANGGSVEM